MISRAVPSARDFFRAKLSLGRGCFLCGASSVRGSLPPPGLVRLPGGFPHAPGLALYYSLPRCMPACPAGRAPRRAFPCRSACRRTLPGAFFRVLRACGCPRRTVVPPLRFRLFVEKSRPGFGYSTKFFVPLDAKNVFCSIKNISDRMKKVDVILGLQWGDEGKGKVVDVLTPRY